MESHPTSCAAVRRTTPPTDETTGSSEPSDSAAPTTTAAPSQPTSSDLVLLQFAMSMEMTARDLYQTSIDAGADDPLVSVLRNNHRGYVDILRAILGTSAVDRRNEQLYVEYVGAFEETDITALAEIAYDFESTAVATTHRAAAVDAEHRCGPADRLDHDRRGPPAAPCSPTRPGSATISTPCS